MLEDGQKKRVTAITVVPRIIVNRATKTTSGAKLLLDQQERGQQELAFQYAPKSTSISELLAKLNFEEMM